MARRRRNTDEDWRKIARQAATGDLQAARRLVRALERAGEGKVVDGALTDDMVDEDGRAEALVSLSITADSMPDLRDVLLERVLGERSGNVSGYRAVDVTDDGRVVLRVSLDNVGPSPGPPPARPCVRCGAASACTCANLVGGDRDWTCPQHGLESDYDPDLSLEAQDMPTEPLCNPCFDEVGMCDDWCATAHVEDCDGFCEHFTPSHLNECTSDAEDRATMRERRESR